MVPPVDPQSNPAVSLLSGEILAVDVGFLASGENQ